MLATTWILLIGQSTFVCISLYGFWEVGRIYRVRRLISPVLAYNAHISAGPYSVLVILYAAEAYCIIATIDLANKVSRLLIEQYTFVNTLRRM